jgi:hypothetical protein
MYVKDENYMRKKKRLAIKEAINYSKRKNSPLNDNSVFLDTSANEVNITKQPVTLESKLKNEKLICKYDSICLQKDEIERILDEKFGDYFKQLTKLFADSLIKLERNIEKITKDDEMKNNICKEKERIEMESLELKAKVDEIERVNNLLEEEIEIKEKESEQLRVEMERLKIEKEEIWVQLQKEEQTWQAALDKLTESKRPWWKKLFNLM